MKDARKAFLLCYFIYTLLFISIALTPFPTIGEDGRILIFDTLYRSGLIIPFCINTIFVIYLLLHKISEYLRK